MPKDDRIRLQHMLDNTREALAFSKGVKRIDLDKNRLLVLALLKILEIIGEAAARTGETTQEMYPSIPWIQIIAMRNRLVHVYFEIDLDQVWQTIQEDLPMLEDELTKILES